MYSTNLLYESMFILLTLIFTADTLPRMTSEPSVSAKPDSYQIRRGSKGSRENLRRDSQGKTDHKRQSREFNERQKSWDSETEIKPEKKETEISAAVTNGYESEPKVIPVTVQVEERLRKTVVTDRPTDLPEYGKQNYVEHNRVSEQIKPVENARPKLKEIAKLSSQEFTRTIDHTVIGNTVIDRKVEVEQRQVVLEAEPVVVATTTAPAVETKTVTKPVEVAPPVVGMNGLPPKGSGDHVPIITHALNSAYFDLSEHKILGLFFIHMDSFMGACSSFQKWKVLTSVCPMHTILWKML